MIPLTVCAFLLIELIVVAYCDIKSKKVFNVWSLLNILLYVVFIIIFDDIYSLEKSALFIPIAWIVVGLFLYKWNIMGAGDSKYLCTFFLLIPPGIQGEMFLCLALCTLLIGAPLFFVKLYKMYWKYKNHVNKKITYAPIILLSYIIFIIKYYRFIRL